MISKRLRFAVLERDAFACHYCGAQDSLEVDHVIPRSLGGQDIIGNLVAACMDCNRGKGASTLSPEGLRAAMKSLRPLKRSQMAESASYFAGSTATVTQPKKDYVRDISGAMGRGRSLEEALAHFLQKCPADAAEIQAAGAKVLERRAQQWMS